MGDAILPNLVQHGLQDFNLVSGKEQSNLCRSDVDEFTVVFLFESEPPSHLDRPIEHYKVFFQSYIERIQRVSV